MNEIPHIVEAALLLLVAFLIGCIIGWFLRSKIFRQRPSKSPVPAQAVSKAATVPDAKPIVQAVPDVPKPAQVKTAPATSGKPTKKPKPTAKPKTAAKPKTDKAKTNTTKADKPVVQATKAEPTEQTDKPAALAGPRDGKPDDLKKIKGIGPKLENTLNGLGIYHFDQIAQWTEKEVVWVDDFLSFKGRISRDNWITQAKDLK